MQTSHIKGTKIFAINVDDTELFFSRQESKWFVLYRHASTRQTASMLIAYRKDLLMRAFTLIYV